MNEEKRELEKNLEKDFDNDLRDMVEVYRAFKRLGMIGTAVFGSLTVLAGLIYAVIKFVKGVK